ncbi:hypothetical protein JB92DRAFT_2878302 [Gautieria morchelliformis]|nr:hypothetical protein JB92DRAFT_2878302 [Gautieria morchelliformis]
MSTTTLTTTDLLPSSVPKLLDNGLNWTTFSMCFQDAVEAKCLWGYFDGTMTQGCPQVQVSTGYPASKNLPSPGLTIIMVQVTRNPARVFQARSRDLPGHCQCPPPACTGYHHSM